MREIRFRAWDYNTKSWHDFHKSKSADDVFGVTAQSGYVRFNRGDMVLCQYTGLKDKNGVEGYHQDIVLMAMFTFVIEWDDKTAKFYLKSTNNLDTQKYTMSHFTKNGEVIGNIWENGDLLKAQTP